MKKTIILIMLLINVFLLSSCYQPPELHEIGFNYDMQSGGAIAARCKSKTYNINEPIVFDLFFGYEKHCDIYKRHLGEMLEPVSYALYLGSYGFIDRFQQLPTNYNKDKVYEQITDFKEIPGFIREVTLEEYDSEEYYVEMPQGKRKVFNHSEEITIPREFIGEYPYGNPDFYLYLVFIGNHKEVGYIMLTVHDLQIDVHFVDSETFRLWFN